MAQSTASTSTKSRPTTAAGGFALWSLGFRPFYLLAGVYATVSVPLWVCQYGGYLPAILLPNRIWHGHEMVFGYTLAVIAGFLLTVGSHLDRSTHADRRDAGHARAAVDRQESANADTL